jgi:hypothetical protein
MRELSVLIILALLGGLGYTYFVGRSHAVNFHYNCKLDIPWYEAFFLSGDHCPGSDQSAR